LRIGAHLVAHGHCPGAVGAGGMIKFAGGIWLRKMLRMLLFSALVGSFLSLLPLLAECFMYG
jgi:uncharacterized membrane protein (Fun14 family)